MRRIVIHLYEAKYGEAMTDFREDKTKKKPLENLFLKKKRL